jgi:hypothetical protein
MFGQFMIEATLTGAAGVIVGFSGFAKNRQLVNRFIAGCCCIGILGAAVMAVRYNFGWGLNVPFIAALALICYTRIMKISQYYQQ